VTNRPLVPVPPGLIAALDGCLEAEVRMRPEHIAGVLDWIHAVLTLNVESHVALSIEEIVLIANALGDAIGAPITEIDTKHVRDVVHPLKFSREVETALGGGKIVENAPVLMQELRITDPNGLVPELERVLRTRGFLEAVCCDKGCGLANPDCHEDGDEPPFRCPTCGASFVVAIVNGAKTLVRKEHA
jgi:hypothetical protein